MTFSNPILAGEELIRSAIRSEDYDPGVAGWRIARTGSAEFTSVTLRENAIVIGLGGASIEINVFGGFPALAFETALGSIYNIDADDTGLHIGIGGMVFHSLKLLTGSGILMRSEVVGSAPAVLFDKTDGFLKAATYTPSVVIAPWVALSLAASWVNVGGYTPAGHKRMPDGTLQLRGVMNGGTTTDGTTIATLPVGSRPLIQQFLSINCTAVGASMPRMQINTNGTMQIYGVGAGAAIGLDSIFFPLT